jgi:hypothetical protein
MRSIRLIVCTIPVAGLMTLSQGVAQSTVNPAKTNEEIPPIAVPSASPQLPDVSQLDEVFKQTSLGQKGDEFRRHVEWRRLENQVANDPAVVAAKKAAEAAHTDLEKRKRLSDYYNIYYKRMEALAETPDMKAALAGLKAGHLGMLAQPRVRPTPTPSPTATPTPSPIAPAVHIEPPLPSAAPAPSPAAAGPAPSPNILPTPIPAAGVIPSPGTSPSPTPTAAP